MKNRIIETINAEIGLFWIVKDQIVAFVYPLADLTPDSLGFVNPPTDHDTVWHHVQAAHPSTRGKDYFEVPRGRVIYSVPYRQFRVVTSSAIANNRTLVFRIARQFHIPPARLIAVADAHYEG